MRGQLSIFVLLGMIILIFFGALAYLQPWQGTQLAVQNDVLQTEKVIKHDLEECYKTVAQNVLQTMGLQGGNPVLVSFQGITDIHVRDWLNNKTDRSPKLSELETYFEKGLALSVDSCTSVVSDNHLGTTLVSTGPSQATALFLDKGITVNLITPIEIRKGTEHTTLSKFTLELPVRMKHIYEIAKKITRYNAAHPDVFSEDFLSEFDVDFQIKLVDKNMWLYVIVDPYSIVNGEQYSFVIGQRYD